MDTEVKGMIMIDSSIYEQLRRMEDGYVLIPNNSYMREYIKKCESALGFKEKYCKGEILCVQEEDKEENNLPTLLRKQAKLYLKMSKELEKIELMKTLKKSTT